MLLAHEDIIGPPRYAGSIDGSSEGGHPNGEKEAADEAPCAEKSLRSPLPFAEFVAVEESTSQTGVWLHCVFIGTTYLLCWLKGLGIRALKLVPLPTYDRGITCSFSSKGSTLDERGGTCSFSSKDPTLDERGDVGEDPAELEEECERGLDWPKILSRLLLIFNLIFLPWLVAGDWEFVWQPGQV